MQDDEKSAAVTQRGKLLCRQNPPKKAWGGQQEGWMETCNKGDRSLFQEERGVSFREGIHAPFR